MLKNLYNEAEEGCLMGVCVWGNPATNHVHPEMKNSIVELGFEPPKSRTNFHLYNKVGELAEKTGWEVVVSWDQTSSFPYTKME